MLVSILAVGVVCWLKGDLGSLALAEGGGGDVQGKLKAESCEVSNLHDPEGLGSRFPSETVPPGDTVPSAPCSG